MEPKAHILAEIRRLAAEDGKPPGVRTFERKTGIKETEWWPDLWLRWGDALEEAGLTRNTLTERMTDEHLAGQCARLAQRLGHLPLVGELLREAKINSEFPSETVLRRRFGGKPGIVKAVAAFCRTHEGFDDVLAWCEAGTEQKQSGVAPPQGRIQTGFVYLMQSGRHYKIGRTNALGRREWELGIKIPVPPRTVHHVETDDPVGVEAYWHRRFESKHGEGEWFNLTADDVAAFKRWKRIV